MTNIIAKAEAAHVQAAFINAIREEGTKAEACDQLQKLWNEHCALIARVRAQEAEIARLRDALTLIERLYYLEDKDAGFRAACMNAVAFEAQSDSPDLGRFHRIFPRAALTEASHDRD